MSKRNDTLAGYLFILLLFVSLVITFIILSNFNFTGILFLQLLVFGTLWITFFIVNSITLYKDGSLISADTKGDMSTGMESLLVFVLFAFLNLTCFFAPKKIISESKNNIFKSIFYSIIFTSVSVIPYALLFGFMIDGVLYLIDLLSIPS